MIKLTDDIFYIGVDDNNIDLFEGMYPVKDGVSYNSYVIKDQKTAVLDTVDAAYTDKWLDELDEALGGKQPDYLIICHMECDHSAGIKAFAEKYPEAKIVGNKKSFTMLNNFFGGAAQNRLEVSDGETLSLGNHNLKFIFAPMVHWPEVMVAFDDYSKTLFSADAFGKFGKFESSDGEDWEDEARRYYIGIVGKYGAQVVNLLNKLSVYKIERICPLHGAVITNNLAKCLDKYCTWASYSPESDGIMIAYTSVYGHTARAAEMLAKSLSAAGVTDVYLCDLAREERSESVAQAFRYKTLVLATTTYNADIFPAMREFINCLTERNYQNRTVAFIENGSWLPMAAKLMRAKFENSKNLRFAENTVSILSEINENNVRQLELLSNELCK